MQLVLLYTKGDAAFIPGMWYVGVHASSGGAVQAEGS
jgi:hypothetical protein